MARLRSLVILALIGLTACGGVSLPYTDSFDDASGRWTAGEQNGGERAYRNGEFTILVSESNMNVWSILPVNQADVVIEVDARTATGALRNDYGVMCRYNDGVFYYFAISADGYAAIMLVDAGAETGQTFTVVAPESGMMEPNEVINRGYAANHIRAACIGNELTLEINDEDILSVTDDGLVAPGDVGLAAGTFERGRVRVNFDDFSVEVAE